MLLTPSEVLRDLQLDLTQLDAWKLSWTRLPRDPYLRDGGRYRARNRGLNNIYGCANATRKSDRSGAAGLACWIPALPEIPFHRP